MAAIARGRAVDPGGLAGPGRGERRLGRQRWPDFPDRQVLVHGDATPTNFLFPDTAGSPVALDLERLRPATASGTCPGWPGN